MYILVAALSVYVLYRGAHLVVSAASKIATRYGIRPFVIAVTVVAFGTSAPELFASLAAAWAGSPNLVLGNIVGSNIANIGLIAGLSAAISPLAIDPRGFRQQMPWLVLAAVTLGIMTANGIVSNLEGIILVVLSILFTLYLIFDARRTRFIEVMNAEIETIVLQRGIIRHWIRLIVGFVMLVIGSQGLVAAALHVARTYGVGEIVIGITMVAVGTSIPELITSVVATVKGHTDIALGNVIGSNILNILFILGIVGVYTDLPIDLALLRRDIPALLIFTGVLVLQVRSRYQLGRLEGYLLLALYAAYIGVLFMITL